jgi:DNA-binding GntR family transcriptional regulator
MTVQPLIARRSLHDEIVSRLRDMISEGVLKPGTKVPERELCLQFGVSRTPMREALKVLAAEGLLDLPPNRGAVVSRIKPEEIEDLFPIMGALEALAGELACTRIDDAQIAAIARLHAEMVGHFERGEWVPYTKLNRQIHEAIFAAAGNAALGALYQSLLVRTHSVRFLAQRSQARWQEAVDDHVAILAALEARDGARLAALLRQHLTHKAEMVREAVDRLDEGSTAA